MTDATPETKPVPPEPITFNCGTCADRGEVGLILESFAGPVRKAIPCPECGGKPLSFVSARDAAFRALDSKVKNLAKLLVFAIALAAFALIMAKSGGGKLASELTELHTNIGEGVKP